MFISCKKNSGAFAIFAVLATLCLFSVSRPAFAADSASTLYASGQKSFENSEYSKARGDWEKAAALGDTDAMVKLAEVYSGGAGVHVDYKKALQYLHRAADKGNAKAMYEISGAYQAGLGVQADQDTSKKWLYKAANADSFEAMHFLLNAPESLAWLTKKAKAGDYRAMLSLANQYAPTPICKGRHCTMPPMPPKEKYWFDKGLKTATERANKGDVDAMHVLGQEYGGSVGMSFSYTINIPVSELPPNRKDLALKWYLKAASHGDTGAMWALVGMYPLNMKPEEFKKLMQWEKEGMDPGKKPDALKEAEYWYKKRTDVIRTRAKKGSVDAMDALVGIYNGYGILGLKKEPPNGAKAFMWAKKAMARGSIPAMYMVAGMYENDQGHFSEKDARRFGYPAPDCKKSYALYKKAADEGYYLAKFRLSDSGDWGAFCHFSKK